MDRQKELSIINTAVNSFVAIVNLSGDEPAIEEIARAAGEELLTIIHEEQEIYLKKIDRSELLAAAGKACIDIYIDLHVSEIKNKPEHLKQAWSIGQELYLKKINS